MRRLLLLVATLAAALTILTVAPARADTSYGCEPSCTGWAVRGQFGDGAVMESRISIVRVTAGYGYTKSEWRLRKGTTPVSNAIWDMNGTSDSGLIQLWRATGTDAIVTFRNYASDIAGSYISLTTPPDCDNTYNSAQYIGYGLDVRVYNPGTGTKSGFKTAISDATPVISLGC